MGYPRLWSRRPSGHNVGCFQSSAAPGTSPSLLHGRAFCDKRRGLTIEAEDSSQRVLGSYEREQQGKAVA